MAKANAASPAPVLMVSAFLTDITRSPLER